MPLTEKTKKRLLSLIAICPIMQFGTLPCIVGMAYAGIGIHQQIDELVVVGFVLALPIIWVYFVILCIYIPCAVAEKLWKR